MALCFACPAVAQELVRVGEKLEPTSPVTTLVNVAHIDTRPIQEKAAEIRLSLPDGTTVEARRSHTEIRAEDLVWRGKIGDHDITLTLRGEKLAGVVNTPEGTFEIRPDAYHGHVISQVDPRGGPPLAEPIIPDLPPTPPLTAEEKAALREGPEKNSVVTVLAVYTEQARIISGGRDAAELRITNAIDAANTALASSQVGSRFNMVHITEIPFPDSQDPVLNDLRRDPTITSLRNAYNADIVAVVVGITTVAGGRGYLMNNPGQSFAPYAISWSSINLLSIQVLGHEMGHNLGLSHDPANGGAPQNASFVWSFGHFVDGSFRTIMSYDTECEIRCPVRGNYSNPNVFIGGEPTGIAGRRDNHRTLLTTMPIAANFRSGTVSAPAAPSGLSAQTAGLEAIDLNWSDNAINESGYEIQRRRGDGGFSTVAQISANSTSYRDSGLISGTTYSYRVRARNSAGTSAYSNAASATTAGEPPPGALVAVATSSSTVQLDWIDESAGELGFEIEARTFGEFYKIAEVPADTESTEITGLFSQLTYAFRIRTVTSEGSSGASEAVEVTLPQAEPEPCASGDEIACLNLDRFHVEIEWRDATGRSGRGQVVPVDGQDSGLFWFFGADNWELLVKVLNGCGFNEHFWAFAAATTNVEYTLRVKDAVTGYAATYFNPQGTSSAAITDIEALPVCTTADLAPDQAAPSLLNALDEFSAASAEKIVTTAEQGLEKVDCEPGSERLCLSQDRFRVEIEWQDFDGNTGTGRVVPFGSADSGLFWFFSPGNWEILVKVLDGCGFNDRFWVFAAATTNVRYVLKVTDTVSGEVKEYENPLGQSSPAITDTEAFATCQ